MKQRRILFRGLAMAALVGTVMASALSPLLLTAGFLTKKLFKQPKGLVVCAKQAASPFALS